MMENTHSQEKSKERTSKISDTINLMRKTGMACPDDRVYISIPDAKDIFVEYFEHFLSLFAGRGMIWLPEYKEIVDWLTDNKGLGLFMFGHCGRGKSIIARYVLPAILLQHSNLVMRAVNVQDMNNDIDKLLTRKIISVDDVGTEDIVNSYGNKRLAFAEVMDSVEKYSKLIVVTTNLNQEEIIGRYGDRVLDRIRSTTKRVLFKGDSLRG